MENKEILEIPLKDLGLDNSLPDPVMYQYYKNLKNRKIIINDQIGADIVEMVMIPLLDMDKDGTGKPRERSLNTGGGSLLDGASLCNIIDELKGPTTITAVSETQLTLPTILRVMILVWAGRLQKITR